MVLTDRQRTDLHAAIYAYLLSREGKHFEEAAEALAEADPSCAVEVSDEGSVSTRFSKMSVSSTSRIADLPILERKWTAVPRLQRKIMELEKALAANAKLYAHKPVSSVTGIVTNGSSSLEGRRMLPRLPSTHRLEGHSSVVTCVALHPKFTTAASGSEDGTIKLWDHESGEYQRTLKGHTNNVHSVDFTPSGSHLVSCSSDLSIKLWDLSTFTCIRTLRGHDHTISAVKFIPSVSNESSDGANGVKITDTSSTTGINSNITGCQFLVSASRDNSVKFWDVETGFCDATLNYHSDWVRCLAVRTMDGELVASAGNDQTIHVCKTNGSREKIATLNGHEHVVECLAFVTVPAPSEKKEIKLENKDIVKDYLVSGGRDRTVRLWNIVTQECLSVFKYHENWVRSIVLHPSGKYILSTGDDRSIRILDIKSNRCIRTLDDAHSHFITSLAIHHTLPIMVTGSVDQTVRCWQLD